MAEVGSIQFIVNPIAGRSENRGILDSLCHRMRAAGHRVEKYVTQGPGEARSVTRRCCLEGVGCLVVSGGDGTISEVVDGISEKGVPILLVPSGTENLLARYLQIRLDASWLWHVFQLGRQIQFDVAQYNDRRFLMVAGVGSDGEIVRRLAERRRGHISYWDYIAPVWGTFWGYRHPSLIVEADGKLIHQGPGWALVGNMPEYALGLSILFRARPDDGLLDVCVFRYRGPLRLLWQMVKVLLRGRPYGRDVVYEQARCIRIRSDCSTPVQVDGDFAGWLPAEFKLAEHGVRFFVDERWGRQ